MLRADKYTFLLASGYHVTVFTPKVFEGVANGTLMAFGQPVPAAE